MYGPRGRTSSRALCEETGGRGAPWRERGEFGNGSIRRHCGRRRGDRQRRGPGALPEERPLFGGGAGQRCVRGHQQGKFRHCARWVRRGARHFESENERPGQPADGPDLGGAGRALLPGGGLCGVPAGGGAAPAGGAVPAGTAKRRPRPGTAHRGRGQGFRAQLDRARSAAPCGPGPPASCAPSP